ncbi:MAG: hypothetical protein M3Z03_12540 [Actinomycetota bacterium]|nr:hypothetical protein [Actinomycetota bacterium]
MQFVELIVAVHDHLRAADLPHAFGGALALAFVAEPRGTADIDVNVFTEELDEVTSALLPLRYSPIEIDRPVPIAGIRFAHPVEPFPIDVFPSLHERYEEAARRIVHHPFGPQGRVLPFLSGEDLCVFKLSFGRAKDWVDLAAIVDSGLEIDIAYIEEQLVALRGPSMYPEVARLRSLLRARRSG